MDTGLQIKMVQTAYAGALADAALQYAREGVLDRVTARKKAEHEQGGRMRAAQLGITNARDVPLKVAEVFGCAAWTITDRADGFDAVTSSCLLCSIARKAGAPRPCELYCVSPMRGMMRALEPALEVKAEETLWDGQRCLVRVSGAARRP